MEKPKIQPTEGRSIFMEIERSPLFQTTSPMVLGELTDIVEDESDHHINYPTPKVDKVYNYYKGEKVDLTAVLPVEMILYIKSFLDKEAVENFSFVSRYLYKLLPLTVKLQLSRYLKKIPILGRGAF